MFVKIFLFHFRFKVMAGFFSKVWLQELTVLNSTINKIGYIQISNSAGAKVKI